MYEKEIKYIDSKQIVKILSERLSLDEEMIEVIIAHWLRMIFHNIKEKVFININDFFQIYEINNYVNIRFSNRIIKHIEKNGLYVK